MRMRNVRARVFNWCFFDSTLKCKWLETFTRVSPIKSHQQKQKLNLQHIEENERKTCQNIIFVPSHKKSHPAIEPVNLDALRPCALCLSVWQRGAVLKCQLACTPVEVMAIKRWWIIINALWEMWCVITWQKSCAWCAGWETADGWVKWREAESKSEHKIKKIKVRRSEKRNNLLSRSAFSGITHARERERKGKKKRCVKRSSLRPSSSNCVTCVSRWEFIEQVKSVYIIDEECQTSLRLLTQTDTLIPGKRRREDVEMSSWSEEMKIFFVQ